MAGNRRDEWITILLAAGVYGGWATVVLTHTHTPWPATVALLAVLLAWHGSLQHEVLHGHPFADQRANDAIGWIPIGVRLAYPVYKRNHLAHHGSSALTDPDADTESFYVRAATWNRLGPLGRLLLLAHHTLLGRMVLGPAVEAAACCRSQLQAVRGGDRRVVRWWLTHFAGVAAVLAFALGVAGLPWWQYGAAVYCAHALSLVRSFPEHRAVDRPRSPTAVVTAGRFWSLLFLNNNLHLAHHERPAEPWFGLPRAATDLDVVQRAGDGAGTFAGYGEVFRRYLVRPIDHPVHPDDRAQLAPVR